MQDCIERVFGLEVYGRYAADCFCGVETSADVVDCVDVCCAAEFR